ncbi:hypothetical protein A8F94_14595 [Bacillus sp. FJAT-27225]|nr:hypothetical protein A8F94_14595 [Bacillus sp. FJAT-27225]
MTSIYILLVLGSIVFWGFTAQDANGLIYPSEHRGTLWSFAGLLLLGVILAGISFAGVRDKSKTVNKKTVIAGLTIGFGFLLWRVLMSLT